MTSAFEVLDSTLNDLRLLAAYERWNDLARQIVQQDKVAIVHHSDLDGLIGAAYANALLGRHRQESNLAAHWVGTEEYDFLELTEWLSNVRPDLCLIFDISIANNWNSLATISQPIKKLFIFDHHLINADARSLPPNVILANPTPKPLKKGETPVPTFLFAMKLARQEGLEFPNWLVLLAMFAEGVDFAYRTEIEELSKTVLEISGAGELRQRYRQSALARAATLVRAAYSVSDRDNFVLAQMTALALGQIQAFDDFRLILERRYGPTADEISRSISRLVDEWSKKLGEGLGKKQVVPIFIPGPHAVAGPVASILRGKYPRKMILAWIERDSRAVIELRTGNESRTNFVELLEAVQRKVHLLNYGGHASAAGATIMRSDIDQFIAEFEKSAEELGFG